MASSSYEEVRKDLYTQIHDKLERRDTIDRRFARIGTAEAVLGPSNLRRLFCSIVPLGDSLEKLFGESITADVLASRAEERGLHNFLATLIYAGCSIESARGFIATLLIRPASDGWPIYYEGHNRIDKLPAGTEQLKQIFGTDNELDVIQFRDTQPCFCPIVLYKGEDVRITDGEKQTLPYMSDEVYIDRGSYGMVYRVVIAKGHLANRHSSMANTEPVTMARKDFKKIHDFQKEYEVIKHILCADRKSKNIVETFGSLQLDQTTFSLFMAYAECDLREWMRRTEPPVLESGKSDILKCASGLADGLKFLHSDIRDPNGNRMVCYHMDLKPANILVFPDTEQGKMLWKISDFGMSRIKVSHHHTVTSDRDISAVFEKRAEDTSVSHTVNRRFEGSYLAPESDISVRKMNEKSDIWSLGCVISVVMTYLTQGQNGIEEYAEDRADVSMQSTGKDTDRFFLVSRDPTRPRPHPAIKKNHKSLITEANRRSSGEGSVVERVLSCVEEKVLQLEPRRRESAGYISNKLLDASAAYRKLSEDLGNPGSYTTSQTTSRNAFSRFWHGTFHRQKPDSPKIESWIIPDSKSAVGCSIAPDEFVIAHWTDTRISLYNSQSFPQYPHREMNFIAECGLKGTDSWKSVKLNESYLIASTTRHHSPVYLFDIKGGNLPGLSLDLSYDVVLPVHSSTGIHQIAVSPGGKVLACVVSRDAKRSWVLYADIKNLISRQVRRNSDATLSSSNNLQHIIDAQEPWDMFCVNASASSVTHLLFPSDTTLCCVAQPDITDRHDIKISCLSLATRMVRELLVENRLNSSPREYDSSNQGRLFTELAAISEQTFAILLYENQLFIQNFGDASPTLNRNITFPNYFIVKLLMDRRHSRLFAFGTKSGNGTILLIELPLSHLGDKGKPREIIELPGIRQRDKFTAMVVNTTSPSSQVPGESSGSSGREADEGCYIIMSVYAIAKPMLYKIDLPRPL